ncbi:MAG: SH3 domain-containing protein, partial [Gemmatimonadota bacterium]|nr:SH3 domain-containing protein [Gemmatimonadota bacterium]
MGNDPTSFRARIAAWVSKHPRFAGFGITVSAIALLGIALALGWAVFSDPPQAAEADPTPTPTLTASPRTSAPSEPSMDSSASASPAPSKAPPPPGGTFLYSSVWAVSTVNGLNVRSGPGIEHPSVGRLDAGDLALVIEGGEGAGTWAKIAADGVVGFANVGPQAGPYLLSTPTPWKSYLTRLDGVASNGSSYLAYGNAGDLDYLPYEGGQAPLLLRSDDGVTWVEAAEGLYGRVTAVAAGATGWVALTVGYPGVELAFFSGDGRSWEAGPQVVSSVIAYGPAGWVVLGENRARRSADGRTWSEPAAVSTDSDNSIWLDHLESSGAGYVAFARGQVGAGWLWASTNGSNWVALEIADSAAWISDVELVGNRLLVVLRSGPADGPDGHSFLRRGTLTASGAVVWDPLPIPFPDGLLVENISQGADSLIALGWDARALVPALWRSADGASWQRMNASANTLGGSIGPEPAWGSGGWVAVGTAAEGAGQLPWGPLGWAQSGRALDGAGQQLFRSADGQAWAPAGEPIALTAYPPCPPANEVSTIQLIFLGPFAERCFGDASLTIRGWVPYIEGLGGCCFPIAEPGWLAAAYSGGYLAPAGSRELREYGLPESLPLYLPAGVDPAALRQ